MSFPFIPVHPEGETPLIASKSINNPIEVDTFNGKVHVEWDPDASVTPLGQLPFFIQFLKLGHRFEPWVTDSPLTYASNNAPKKLNVLGSLLLSVLSGHNRYAHISTLTTDNVAPGLLGMTKVVSDDSARRALKRMDETSSICWLQKHLYASYEPLLQTPWILDTDTTVKPLYGHQEGAEIGYNPKKPGRPSHTYHTYLIANIRLVLDVEVQAGNQSQSSHSLPGLMTVLDALPEDSKPAFIRGDCDWGSDSVMSNLEGKNYQYLFKLRKSKNVKNLIYKHHGTGDWTFFKSGWEAKEDLLKLQGWENERRVVIVRRRIASADPILAVEHQHEGQQQLSFIDGPNDLKAYEYAVLVTNLNDEVVSIIQHYRDRADCENVFDEMKNQWGWGGFTTKDLKPCRLMARIIALVYNWWTLFVRLANPGSHLEAVTSRPLLLSSVGRMTKSGRQQKLLLTSSHNNATAIQKACQRVATFFDNLKQIAPQLSSKDLWRKILVKAMEKFNVTGGESPPPLLPLLS